MNEGNEPLPLGDPPVLEHSTPTGVTEVAQRLVAFPFTPPDVKLKEKEPLSSSNDWYTKHDKNKIDELGSLDFYASTGPEGVGVVPKLHNSAKTYHLLEKISHMDSKTYDRLLDLQKELRKPEVAQWYQTELLFTSTDFNTVKNNVDQAVAILSGRKGNGLFLDANVSAAIGAADNHVQGTETTPGSGNVGSTPSAVISASVGRWEKNASNVPADVETVQRLLQTAAQKLQAPQLDPKGIDGKIAQPPRNSNTVNAIEAFQSRSNISIDGLIEPGSSTWQALLQAAGIS